MEQTIRKETTLDKLMDVLEQIRYENMPEEVIAHADLCMADFMGILCGSTEKEMSVRLRRALTVERMKDPEELAMWMASSARMLDLDDGHRYAMAHPGVVINAAAAAMLTAGGCGGVSGKTLIEALVTGYEVYCFQGRVINPGAYLKRGIDATSVCGAAAAAATASVLMGLDRKQTADAVSLAAALAGGLNQSAIDGSAQKYLVAGAGAKLGIMSARLAKEGLGGPAQVYEGKLGYANAFTPEADKELLENPKLNWDIRNVYLKIHACVRRIHATLDAVKNIVGTNGLKEKDLVSIEVGGGPFLCDAAKYRPQDMAQAQTSVPYTVAILLRYGCVEDDLVEKQLNNEEIHRLSVKVTVVPDAEIEELGRKDKSLWGAARVTVHTADGRTFSEVKPIPDGDRESPFREEILKEKFVSHSAAVLGREYAEQCWEQFMKMDLEERPGDRLGEILRKAAS